MNKKRGLFTLCCIFFIILSLSIFLFFRAKTYSKPVTNETVTLLDLNQVNKVMIVAHPDDEMIWGGGHLLSSKYLVVCLTNGNNETRKEEFNEAVRACGSIPLMLSYPDKIFGIRSRWLFQQKKIEKDIQFILSYKDWEEVATHNPEGEYGHIHHKKTSTITRNAWKRTCSNTSLFYFGTYYNKEELRKVNDFLTPIDENILKRKLDILKLYESQDFIDKKFGHMYPYEMWVQAESES